MTLTLDPKVEFSCQDSLVPGLPIEPSHPLALDSNGDCVNSPYSFKSVIIDSGPGNHSHASFVTQQCRVELYSHNDCRGDKSVIDAADIKRSGCTFVGGRSARLDCGIEPISNAAYKTLGDLCAHSSFPRRNSTAPNPSGKTNGTATATGAMTSSALPPPSISPVVPAMPGVASTEKHIQRSLAALIAVVVAALVLL
ncbi:hypothetical protein LTR09_005643 [Extremus antarcticus]|uniref:Uncharacterized protein n=1 Tax=Extremus antarcticus TaxID=702011 RepID=A0AAJ0DGL8_9PEZI|nr:hypothetical protein LTR09_005643 [Extremus antarcticus]